MLLILTPYVVLAAAFFYSLRAAVRSRSPARVLFLPALLASIALTAGFIGWGFYSIETSSSSTAAIGYLALPFLSLATALLFFLLALAVGVILRWILERTGHAAPRLASTPRLISALLFLSVTGWLLHQNLTRSRLLDAAAAETTAPAELQAMLADALKSNDIELQSTLARNPTLPIPDLARLFDNSQDQVHDRLTKRFALFSSLARNPRTPTGILSALSTSPFSSVRIEVILNPSTPVGILTNMVHDKISLVREYLADNPRLPDDLRRQLKEPEPGIPAPVPAGPRQ